jgi:WD40 repeat protein
MLQPFHLILKLSPTEKIILVSGLHIAILNSKTGEILASTFLKENAQLIDQNVLPKKPITSIAYHHTTNKLAFVSDDKQLQVWDAANMTLLNSTNVYKRVTCCQFTADGKHIFIGDKFGDLYKYDCALTEKPLLLVGHVSIMTDMVSFI